MGRQAAVIAAASGLVLTGGIAANAAETNVQRDASAATALEVQAAPKAVVASSSAKLSFVRTSVTSEPAPVVETPAVDAQSNTVNAQGNAAVTAGPVASTQQAPAAVNVAAATGKGAAIAAAALAQLGVHQDCTALVSNALRAVGINFHDWPAGYMSLGRTVSAAEAQPGDLIYYNDAGAGVPHIAVYIGNGQAVHGGWLGGDTVVATAFLGSGPVFIRVGG
ncbi:MULTISPECIES: NlpC/P60 family protein [Arthrobacter]|uniref:NlpC/P60 family protein n=2 Tax=Arthrobacter TaxID=1663 RepID=A0ABU9KLM4_9MICC|nr:NlpC/P60 family protein [Arthrobacter sp. YJM1]MDP5227753.1 NlpC/P60 family protein [Arthrobacter sp. YJM1]